MCRVAVIVARKSSRVEPVAKPDRGEPNRDGGRLRAVCHFVVEEVSVATVTRERFGQMLEDELGRLPLVFRRRLSDILFVVEDEPSPEDLSALGLDPSRDTLFGLFDGTPLAERSIDDVAAGPDRIVLYYRPLVRQFRAPWALRRQIRMTVIHEVAHFFGMDEDEIASEGYE